MYNVKVLWSYKEVPLSPVILVHHAAGRGTGRPANSLGALRVCLDGRAQAIEVDVQPLADGDFALLHDPLLERATTGHGPVGAATAAQVAGLQLLWKGAPSQERVALLSQVVELVRGLEVPAELQLDLKAHAAAPLTDERLQQLARLIEPLGQRVRVSTIADWALRRLHALAPQVPLGFDPLLYLDVRSDDDEDAPPYRVGAYGYHDEHPLAAVRWGEARSYLALRAEALWQQAPMAGVWYIRASTLARALDDGYDWIAGLHARGALVDAWTLDASEPAQVELARRLVRAGVDRITTNDPPALAQTLRGDVAY